MRLVNNARLAAAALALVATAACGGDSNDPTPFDPAGVTADLTAAQGAMMGAMNGDAGVQFSLVSTYLSGLTGGGPVLVMEPAIRASSRMGSDTAAARQLASVARGMLRSRSGVTGSAVVLPPELLGTTYVWDDGAEDYVASDRTDGPDNGVRFVLYALDPVTHEPAAPLNELGYVDLLDLSTASADIGRILVATQGVTYFDYRVTATGNEDAGDVSVIGYMTDGERRVNFDLGTSFEFSEVSGSVVFDNELEFTGIGVTLDNRIEMNETAAGTTMEFDGSLRGPHGYIDLAGTQVLDGTTTTLDLTFEVNGEEFATYTCHGEDVCSFTNPAGDPLTAAEEQALGGVFSFWAIGALVSLTLMTPIGMFLPLF